MFYFCRKKAGGNRDDRNRDGHLHYVLHREAWHSYCYSVVEQRRRAEKKQEARVKKYCENQGIEDEKVSVMFHVIDKKLKNMS